jgi:protocatechuate 3,4-dioxygenase beta subunit
MALEVLESRTLPSVAQPDYILYKPAGSLEPLQSSAPFGFFPNQVRHAYGVDLISLGVSGIAGDGTGQTIAIVDAYDDPNIKSDLAAFDQAFGLPAPPSFKVVGQDGSSKLPGQDPNKGSGDTWEVEESLDVEWAHSIAPGASLILVEANDPSNNLYIAEATAASLPGVVAVSNSWGASEDPSELGFDSTFTTPAGHPGVTFLASTGDFGEPGGYPAFSPNVVSVGGTSLFLNPDNSYSSETGWGGSGGGISQFEAQPAYQQGVVTQSTTNRTTPDVSFLADPNTGVAIYDSFDFGTSTPWVQVGGTSLACPCWAALVSIADQGRALEGRPPLDGVKDTLPTLYQLGSLDFHDILQGNNGFLAGVGYDLVTGLGSPIANELVPDLIGQGSVINGQVYFDVNGNGIRDPGEPGLAGWTVYIDVNGTGSFQPNDPSTISDAGGYYTFRGLEPGTYTLGEIVPSGWTQITSNPQVTVALAQIGRGVNFGNSPVGRITGQVFQDFNGNGIQESGDSGLAGWTLELEDSSGTVLETGTTDNNGNFFFGVSAGTYTVVELPPSGWLQTTPNPNAIVVPSGGGQFTGVNFGEFKDAVVSGEVFNDPSASGVLNSGDAGLAGWTVQLVDALNNVVDTQTDSTGHYSFANVGPGTYSVQEVTQTGWTQTSANPPSFTPQSGQTFDNLNFGNFQLITISGQVFDDLNADGQQESGEGGLTGWTVQLEDTNGNVLASTSTDSNGDYSFSNLPAGSYLVREVVLSGWAQTTANPPAISVQSGQNASSVNFGNAQQATISGQVFNDQNGNGTQDSGDSGLASWTVQLLDKSGTVLTSTTTDGNGDFSFAGLSPGSYTVREVTQTGFAETTNNSIAVTAQSGQNITGIAFGNFELISISGQAFNDLNDDGLLESGEPGVPGWTIELIDANTSKLLTSQTTDSGGNFAFPNLGPGNYRIREVAQVGWAQSSTNPSDVSAQSGGNVSNVDFGDFQTANIVGSVFEDVHGSGTRLPEDGPLSGWTIQLVSEPAGTVVASTSTDATGAYAFSNVAPGSYMLNEIVPSGWVQTAGPGLVTIVDATTKENGLDFGNFRTVTIGGQAFVDNNGDGIMDGADAPLPGIMVALVRTSGTVVQTQTTNANGAFTFTGVGPGEFQVREQLGAGQPWVQTTPNPATITTTSGAQVSGLLFGNFKTITISGSVLLDPVGSGVLSSADPGLAGFTVQLIQAGVVQGSQITNSAGAYSFLGVGPGQYSLREIVPTGWQQTSANPPNVTAASGVNVAGENFGNFHPFSVSGRVFNDLNGTGSENAGDPGLAGFTVGLYRDKVGNGLLNLSVDPLVASTITAGDGSYSFANLGPGIYIIHEAKPAGVHITTPPFANGDFVVSGAGGIVQTGLDFGNLSDPSRSFVYQAYLDLLHRHVDPVGMAFWSSQLQQGASRQQVVHAIEQSYEYRADEVNAIYVSLLGRQADPVGLSANISLLINLSNIPGTGDPLLQIEANIEGSDEYFAKHGGSIGGFLTALYHDNLGRTADAGGAAFFGGQLARGVSRTLVAKEILFSQESEQDLVNGLYVRFLHRQADAGGLAGFVAALQHGAHVDDIITALMASGEYFAKL